jgi:hypothetical protein
LKIEAAQTDSLNKTLTKTFASPINLSGVNTVKLDMKASRTGANVKLGLHDTGGTTTELTPTIITANEYETKTWDLSGVADANKNAIDKFIITPVNADAPNTAHLDNFRVYQNLTVLYEETITLSEIFGRGVTRSYLETITLSEAFKRELTKQWLENLTLTEIYTRKASLYRLFEETVTLTEVGQKHIQLFFNELVTLSENFTRKIGKTWSETITLSEVFRRAITRTWKETVTLTESFTKYTAYKRLFIDQITLSEIFSYWRSKKPKEGTWTKDSPGGSSWIKRNP